MIAQSRLAPSEAFALTLKQLLVIHDQVLLDAWDHTAAQYSIVQNLVSIVQNYLSERRKVQPLTVQECHPYRRGGTRQGLKINAKNFHVLRGLVGALSRRPAPSSSKPRRRR